MYSRKEISQNGKEGTLSYLNEISPVQQANCHDNTHTKSDMNIKDVT